MDKSTTLRFIEKTIQKTKLQELTWERACDTDPLFPLRSSNIPEKMNYYVVMGGDSFVAKYKTGRLILVASAPDEAISNFLHFNPSKDCEFSLRIQSSIESDLSEIAHSGTDIDTKSQLTRLYNLIDFLVPKPIPKSLPPGRPLDASSLIQDFLDS